MQISNLENKWFLLKGAKIKVLIGRGNEGWEKQKGDIAVVPNVQNIIPQKTGETFIINAPGEYEIGGVSIFGFNNLYLVEIDELKFCYLTDGESELKEDQQEEIGEIDGMLVFLGEGGLTVSQAVKAVEKIQPRLLIVAESEAEFKEKFLKEIGWEGDVKIEEKIIFSRNQLPEEEMQVFLLKPKNG